MNSLISLVWVIAATVVAVPLILTVARPLAQAHLRTGSGPVRSQGAAADSGGGPRPGEPSAVEESGIDTARTEARFEASALKRFREHVDVHPDETRAVLRNWLNAA